MIILSFVCFSGCKKPKEKQEETLPETTQQKPEITTYDDGNFIVEKTRDAVTGQVKATIKIRAQKENYYVWKIVKKKGTEEEVNKRIEELRGDKVEEIK
jgi:uncharacterized protein with FMN-binding domain